MLLGSIFKRPMVMFVLLSNVIFWVFLALIGVCMMINVPMIITNTLIIMSAWSSTFSFIILFKIIYPRLNLIDFIKQQFATKLSFNVLGIAISIQALIFICSLILLPSTDNIQYFSKSLSGVTLFLFLFFNILVSGPLGEELGWRGYALNELQKKYSPLVTAIITGGLWGFWHTPLWLLTSGYTGMNLIKYCGLFMVGIISVTIIMTFFYNLNKNLFVPIIIHQLFNFFILITKGELLDILFYHSLLYFSVAFILIVINPKRILYYDEKAPFHKPLKF
ncbi:type II CAAX endopeptidase family protein [Bacillus spongiae]|uniref:Type II CAAX endopeptidase family protein n=1 Tax=Bacillus spongiae TaxID=2683610 RepID=A0ABU8HFR9_9BACI